MTPPRRAAVRLAAAALVLVSAGAYTVRSRAVSAELREGARAYDRVCERLAASAAAAGSPGTIAHLTAAAELELRELAERYPRWYRAYRRDPAAHPCGSVVPGTQVGPGGS